MRILIVEDDETLADGLTVGLRLAGFTPEQVATCADARQALAQNG
ncbi:MAG: DNA-binding response regulator, partial [Rhodosalinus sp.]